MSKQPRPSVVTLAGVFIAITAFLSLTELVTALTNWGTVEMQDALKPAIRQLDANGVDVTMTELLRMLRWVGLAIIPFLVAAMVCAIYALRGDRRSRLAAAILAVIAGLMSLPLGIFGFLQAAMLFLAAGALWSPDANRWYRGEPASQKEGPPQDPSPQDAPPPAPLADLPAAPTSASTQTQTLTPPPPALITSSRPSSVVTAGLVAIVGSFLAAAMAAIYVIVYTFQREAQMDAVLNGPFGDYFTRADLEVGMRFAYWVFLAVIPLAAVGLLGGIALLARLRIGRPTLIVWAWAFALVGVLMLPLGVLAIAGAIAVILLLRREDVRAWLSSV